MKGTVISEADVAVCDARVTAYFTGVEREEQRLKQDGVIPAQKGGTDFLVELFVETCKLAIKKCYEKPSIALFNLMAWHTCGRSVNVAHMHIEHFVLDGDCMGIQFPVTKSKQPVPETISSFISMMPHASRLSPSTWHLVFTSCHFREGCGAYNDGGGVM